MSEKIKIITPDHVELEFELAGLGSRLMANIIDLLIMAAILAGLNLLALVLSINLSALGSWSLAVFTLLIFGVTWGYFTYFEIRWNGQSPGKKQMKLRVIRDTGHPIDPQASILRNIVRIADYVFSLGLFVLFFSPQSRRLGDYAAGTLVVKARQTEAELEIPVAHRRFSIEIKYDLLDDGALARISRLSRQDYEAIRRLMDRLPSLEQNAADDVTQQIAESLMKRLEIARLDSFRYPYVRLLQEIAQAYERYHGQ